MGEWKRRHNVTWGEETEGQMKFIFETYPSLEQNVSRLVRRAIRRWYKNAISTRTLMQAGEIAQGLSFAQGVRTQFPQAGDGAIKIGPKRVDSLGGNQAERPKISITRRWAGAKESEARFFSFESPNFLRPVFAWRIAQ